MSISFDISVQSDHSKKALPLHMTGAAMNMNYIM